MVERSCIHPFIQQTQRAFQEGSSFRDVLRTIKEYQRRVSILITNVSPEAKLLHIIGTSSIALGGIVLYEYARAHGVPLLDSRGVVGGILPVASISEGDEYYDTDAPVWRYGKERGYRGEELRIRVDEHRKEGHAEIDKNLEDGLLTPEQAEEGKRSWDKKHGYRGRE